MGMEISSRRLQEADSRMQAEREGADRPVDDRDKERFDRAMQESRERDGQGGQENGRGGCIGGNTDKGRNYRCLF